MPELADFANRIGKLGDPATTRRVLGKAGMAGKKAALDAAAADLGDGAFSGMRRQVKLAAGYDVAGDDQVQINFRPSGLWQLAERGRQGTKPIVPRKRGGKRAVLTPGGPRASSTSTPSKGLGTYTDAVKDAQRRVPEAAFRQFQSEISKVVR
jgi:hypothetical protein